MNLKKLREYKQRIDKNRASSGGFSDELKYVIQSGANVVRLVGDPQLCIRAWILGDDNKPSPYAFEQDGLWMSMLKDVLDYTMEKDSDGDWHRRYVLADTQPHILKMVRDEGWDTKERYLMNCIPRDNPMAHLKKHAVLLVQSEADIGIGPMAFTEFEKVAENYGDPETYDVVFKKEGSKLKTKYDCQMAVKSNEDYGAKVVEGPLNKEEAVYELYNLEEIVKPTSASTILKNFRDRIASIDEALQTNYVDEWEKLAQEEGGEESKEVEVETVRAPAKGRVRKKKEDEDPIKAAFPKNAKLLPCDACAKEFPSDMTSCPYCGAEYTLED